jgi:hypothetical protein
VAHHSATSGDQDEEEGSQQFGEEAAPFLPGIVEISYSIDDLLFVASDRAELGDFLQRRHSITMQRTDGFISGASIMLSLSVLPLS